MINFYKILTTLFYFLTFITLIHSQIVIEDIIKPDLDFYAGKKDVCEKVTYTLIVSGLGSETSISALSPISIRSGTLVIGKINDTHSAVALQFIVPVGIHNISVQMGSTIFPNITSYECENVPSSIVFIFGANPANRHAILDIKLTFQILGLKPKKIIDGTLECAYPQPYFRCILGLGTLGDAAMSSVYSISLSLVSTSFPFNGPNIGSPTYFTITDKTNPLINHNIEIGSVLPPTNILNSVSSSNVFTSYYPTADVTANSPQFVPMACFLTIGSGSISTSIPPFMISVNQYRSSSYRNSIKPLLVGPNGTNLYHIVLSHGVAVDTPTRAIPSQLYGFNGTNTNLFDNKTININMGELIIAKMAQLTKADKVIPNNGEFYLLDTIVQTIETVGFPTPTFTNVNPSFSTGPFSIDFPLGYASGNRQNFKFAITSIHSTKSTPITNSLKILNNETSLSIPPYDPNIQDTIKPNLINLEYKMVNYTHLLVRVHVSDEGSGILSINFRSGTLTSKDLVKGTIFDGFYEKIFQYASVQFLPHDATISVWDRAYNRLDISKNYPNSLPLPINPISKYFMDFPFSSYNISSIKFRQNDFNVFNAGVNTTMELKLSVNPFNGNPEFYSQWPVFLIFTWYSNENTVYRAVWNENLKLFTIDFYIPPRVYPGVLQYNLRIINFSFNYYDIYGALGVSSELRTETLQTDQSPPVVTGGGYNTSDTIIINSAQKTSTFGWWIQVEDNYNGIGSVEFTVRSTEDPLPYVISFPGPVDNVKVIGSSLNRTYILNIEETYPCKSRVFEITDITLKDQRGFTAYHSRDQVKSFVNVPYFDTAVLKSKITLTCENMVTPAPPFISKFNFNPKSIDVGAPSDSARTITLDLETTSTTGLSRRHFPVFYLSYGIGSPTHIKVPTTYLLSSFNENTFSYRQTVVIPRGEAIDTPILVSVYGITDKSLQFRGYTTSDLMDATYPAIITTNYTRVPIIDSYGPSKIGSNDKSVTLYGSNFQPGVSKIQINYGTTGFMDIGVESMTGVICSTNSIQRGHRNYLLRVVTGQLVSNTISIDTFYQPPITESPTESPFPTPSPGPKCPGSPPCGGSNQGICDDNLGCLCISPWYGFNCGSQVINTTKPDPDTGKPDSKTDGQLPNGSDINFTSLISMVSLRELNFVGEAIKTFNFSIWIFDNLSDESLSKTLYRYSTNVTNSIDSQNGKTTSTQESQSMIGINLRNYKESVILDPDFSVIVDYHDSNNPLSTCSKKSGLSKTQIAGIVIGAGVAFIALATASTIYYFKRSKEQKAMKNLNNKLKQVKS
eukprot:gene5208-6486_t